MGIDWEATIYWYDRYGTQQTYFILARVAASYALLIGKWDFSELKYERETIDGRKIVLTRTLKPSMRRLDNLNWSTAVVYFVRCPFSAEDIRISRVIYYIHIANEHACLLSGQTPISLCLREKYQPSQFIIQPKLFYKCILAEDREPCHVGDHWMRRDNEALWPELRLAAARCWASYGKPFLEFCHNQNQIVAYS